MLFEGWGKGEESKSDGGSAKTLPSGQGQKTTTNKSSQVYVQGRNSNSRLRIRRHVRRTGNKPKKQQRSGKLR